MNWLEGFNRVIAYIENHLEDEIDNDEIAAIMGYSAYHVQRLFTMVAGIPLAEYIRNRRLSKAAVELQSGENKVIDIALKYGYSSPNSFNRAFKALHGVPPSDVKKDGVTLKAYPPLSFELTIRGAQTMNYRIEQKKAFRIVGIKLQTTMENGESYQSIPAFWSKLMQNGGPNDILSLMNKEPIGLLGVSDYEPDFSTGTFDYYIACSTDNQVLEDMSEFEIPACTWAIFPCENGEVNAIQKLQQRIVTEWLPTSGFEFAKAPDIEVYGANGEIDIWLPIVKT